MANVTLKIGSIMYRADTENRASLLKLIHLLDDLVKQMEIPEDFIAFDTLVTFNELLNFAESHGFSKTAATRLWGGLKDGNQNGFGYDPDTVTRRKKIKEGEAMLGYFLAVKPAEFLRTPNVGEQSFRLFEDVLSSKGFIIGKPPKSLRQWLRYRETLTSQ